MKIANIIINMTIHLKVVDMLLWFSSKIFILYFTLKKFENRLSETECILYLSIAALKKFSLYIKEDNPHLYKNVAP